jgi:hypothetical protein
MASKASIQLDVISYFVVSDERKKKSYYAENKKRGIDCSYDVV